MAIYQTAVQYQTSHALGLLLIALLIGQYPRRLLVWAGYLLAGGILLFSGSLYLMVFTAERWLGMITPLGGSAFILGWCLLVFGRLRPPTLDNRQETKQ